MASQIPSVPYLSSQYRICKGMQRVYRTELLMLENELLTNQITQKIYDESVAAITRDMEHLASVRQALTEIKHSIQEKKAA